MLSGELTTLLSGRYVEISILPLSFREYCQLQPGIDTEVNFSSYLQDGGFPYIASMDRSKEKTDMYLEGIYNTIIIKDIEDRQRRREADPNKRRVTDIALLKSIAKFLASSVGNPISIKSITDYIISSGRKVSQNTISDYIEVLTEAFIFYPVENALDVTMAQRSELDYLICNDPLGYADLILNGDPEEYLKNVTGSHGLED